jgi:tetratricopeptide (TPR) repeat protein
MSEVTRRAGHRPSPQTAPGFSRNPDLAAAARFHATGDSARAEAACRKVLAGEPTNATALLMLAELALGRNEIDPAMALIRQALEHQPNLPLAHFALGRALHTAVRLEEACAAYRQAVALRPNFATAHCNLALVLFDLKDYPGSLNAARRALELDPRVAETHMAVGNAMSEMNQPQLAVAALRRAVEINPNLADAQQSLGRMLQLGNDFEGAIACYRKAIGLKPSMVLAHYRLGTALQHLERNDEAIATFRRAIELDPGLDASWNALGTVQRSIGRFDEAANSFRRALELNPNSGVALRNLSMCETRPGDDAELTSMAVIADDPAIPSEDRVSAAFGMGKWLDDAGRYDEAFARYVQANALCRKNELDSGARFDPAALTREVDDLARTFGPDFFAARAGWGVPSEVPVFIVGLFRSGTTLVEQIAASHPAVHGAGELSEIRTMTAALMKAPGDAVKLVEEGIRRGAGAHLERLRAKAPDALRVIDKNPDNIFSLGLIATLFPEARVVFCHREPRDGALSCFVQAFSKRQPWASDLADCARRWHETERLSRLWRDRLPLRMLDIQYETLVGDLEGQSRRLIDFLGLDWDPACLRYHETERAVKTASTWQVRQPIYTSSIGRWRNYERHIGPMLEVFRTAGVALD